MINSTTEGSDLTHTWYPIYRYFDSLGTRTIPIWLTKDGNRYLDLGLNYLSTIPVTGGGTVDPLVTCTITYLVRLL